jgi:uncharacterized linocin/CFP29 family protein
MADFLSRDDSPLNDEQWAAIDQHVSSVAEATLVGRRFIEISGPWGPGMQVIPSDIYAGMGQGAVDMLGEAESDLIRSAERQHLALPIIFKDFMLHWRDIETSEQFHTPLDTGLVLQAATHCANTEDNLIFHGNAALGYHGLLTAPGRLSLAMADWSPLGAAFDQVVQATTLLTEHGYFGPYALVTSPARYAQLNRVHSQTGVLEVEQIQKLCRAGVFRTALLAPNQAVVVSVGAGNMDLVMALDLVTAYLGPENMNHYFRVLESVALRIKRPESIVALEG